MIGIYCRAGSNAGVITITSSATLSTGEASGAESGFSRCLWVEFGRLGFSIWSVGGVSDAISSRCLWCLRRHLWNDSRIRIMTVTATIAINQRLLGGTVLFLLSLQAGDPSDIA